MDSIFKSHNVIFAHCLTLEGGGSNPFTKGKTLYERIDYVINKKPEISCSTIMQNDTLQRPNSNFFGPIGLILKNTNITYANSGDGGTRVLQSGKIDYTIEPHTSPNPTNITNAILKRSSIEYNEFCADNYDIFGIFLCFDDSKFLTYNIGTEIEFFNNLGHPLQSFILSKGKLYKSEFDPTIQGYRGNGHFQSRDIY